MLGELFRKWLRGRQPADELNRLALEHHARGELDRAEHYFREAALKTPGEASAWINLAVALIGQQKHAAAIPVLMEVIELRPGLAEAHFDLGICHNRLKNNGEAIRHYRTAIDLKPTLDQAHANLVNAYLDCCDWDAVERWTRDFLEFRERHAVAQWAPRLEPFCALSLFPGAINRELAVHRAGEIERSVGAAAAARAAGTPPNAGKKIRVGYVSSDFHAHATAHLTYGLYQAHDREAFEVYAYSLGPDDGSVYRRHIEETCDRFIDARFLSHAATAQRIAADGIDILVDMKGYTANARPQIFAHRAAPVQVAYLGYPATTGARYIDYFVSDRVATPPGYEGEFTERIVYLPGSYQVNDDRQAISPRSPTRAECGLPERAFVYCSFNMLRKIDREIFSTWMEILRRVPDSVLWLIREDEAAEQNLRAAARDASIDPDRLVFADRMDKPSHLARHRLADLFLDTSICNAHTTASDALWAGLPLLTCPGATFARRVAASLLTAVGMPDLIARDPDEYRELAVGLAGDRERLAGMRSRLERGRRSGTLFDTAGYVRNLEGAYHRMVEMNRSGQAPASFSVG